MNSKMLRGMHRKVVKLFPPVQRRIPNGPYLPPSDDDWWIDAQFIQPPAVVRLHNLPTGHFVDIYPDGVQEFREPDQLILKEQLTLVGNAVVRQPLPDRRLAYGLAAPRLRSRRRPK